MSDSNKPLSQILRRGASVSLVSKTAAKIAAFVMTLALARNLTVENYGAFTFVTTWLLFFVIIAVYGLDTASLRYIAQFGEQADGNERSAGFIRWARGRVAVAGALLAIIVYLIAITTGIARNLGHPLIGVAMLVLPLLALTQWQQFVFRARRQVGRGDLIGQILRPMIVAAGAGAAAIVGIQLSAAEAMMLLLGGTFCSVVLAEFWLRRLASDVVRPSTEDRTIWLTTARPMLLITSSHFLLHQLDILMLGSLAGTEHVAPYAVASRLADIVAFSLVVASGIVAPLISSLYHSGRLPELRRTLRISGRWVSLIAAVVAIAFALGREPLLGIFGADYVSAQNVLLILIVGQLLNAIAGPVGFLLSMTGNEKGSAKILGIGVLINAVLNGLLIPEYQEFGAAIATAMTTIYWNIAMTGYAQRVIGVRATPV